MPTYHYYCPSCDSDTYVWESIHAKARKWGTCGHHILRVIDDVKTMGVGKQGERPKQVDETEARWSKDMPAYKRFREKGYQPPGIDGCDKLEATATSAIEIKSGGRLKYSDEMVAESKAYAEEIMRDAT